MRIAVFTKNLTNPAYMAARLGAERAAQVFGAEVLHFVPKKGDDPDQQIALIDEALSLTPAPDAFVLSPVHATRVNEALLRIAAAGIPLVGFVNPIDAVQSVAYVGSDDHALAQGIARYVFDHLKGRGRVLMVSGPVDSYTSLERLRGFRDAATAYPEIELIDVVPGDYVRDKARERSLQWFREHGVPTACLVANDIMAVGVLDALEELDAQSVVAGVNAIPEAISAIGEGRMLATADFNAMQMAYLATECAVRHLQGEPVPANVQLPVAIVDRDNYRIWDQPYEKRPVIHLEELRRQT